MRALRIFLFILIVIGLVLLFTQKFWVEPLVNQILIYQGESVVSETDNSLLDLDNTYKNNEFGFSIKYPSSFLLDEKYEYQEMGPGKEIAGVKFIIPTLMATGTNLSNDSYISVEKISGVKNCSTNLFLGYGGVAKTINDAGVNYLVASSTDAGLGNRYEETVYVTSNKNSCFAVRYFVHYGAFENYPEGLIKRFDKQKLLNQFDQIRRSLNFL
jgi:hypothetical protein